jgi:hypothetical protein
VGHQGEQSGLVYKITIGRSDFRVSEDGAAINARMGLNTWAAFTGTDADAMVAGEPSPWSSSCTTTAPDRQRSWRRVSGQRSTYWGRRRP